MDIKFLTAKALVKVRRNFGLEFNKYSLISYPKSGRTWLRMMIGRCLINEFQLDHPNPMDLETLRYYAKKIPGIGVKHEHKTFEPGKYKGEKIILLARDPRDILVSVYFQWKNRNKTFEGSIEDFVQNTRVLDEIVLYYSEWFKNKGLFKNLLVVRYEDLKSKPQTELKRLFNFLGVKCRSKSIKEAIDFSSFSNMRKMEVENKFKDPRLRPGDKKNPDSFKTRKGKVGGYKDYLKGKTLIQVNKAVKSLPSIYGYS